MHIRILDRYIFKEILLTFLFSICAFTSVFMGSGTLFRIAEYMTEYGASIVSVAKIFVLSLPGVIVWTFPMSILLATLLAFGRLSGGSEITAMLSCGVSFQRLCVPGVILGFAMSLFSLWFNEYIVPWSNDAYTRVLNYEIKGDIAPKSQDHIIIKDIKSGVIQRLLYARRYNSETQQMEGVTMSLFEHGKATYIENAAYAEWKGDEWVMHDGVIYDVAGGENMEQASRHTIRFETQSLPVDQSPREIVNSQKRPEAMTIRELKEQIKILADQYVDTSKLEKEVYERITIPFASFVFALVGMPLGLQPNRSGSSRGFAISLIVIFIYYMLMVSMTAMGQSSAMPLWLGVWMPNIVCFFAGLFFIRQASRQGISLF